MDLYTFLFPFFLFLLGVCCIALVRNGLRKYTAARAERDGNFSRQPRVPEISSRLALSQARAAARKEAAEKRAEVWKNLTPSLVNEAFGNFYRDDAESSFDTSMVSAAFEKFTNEMRVKQ